MKRITSILIICSLLLTACAGTGIDSVEDNLHLIIDQDKTTEPTAELNRTEDEPVAEAGNDEEASSKLDNVRIVTLPPMTVAAYMAEGDDCEGKALNMINKFAYETDLINVLPEVRQFGFDCWGSVIEIGNESQAYEVWVTIPDDMEVSEPYVKRNFEGGMYAVHEMRTWDDWGFLWQWVNESNEYDNAWGEPRGDDTFITGQGLEETLGYRGGLHGIKDMEFDLMLPIKKSNGGNMYIGYNAEDSERFSLLDEANNKWLQYLNETTEDFTGLYIEKAVLFPEKNAPIQGNIEIFDYYKEYQDISVINVDVRFRENANYIYEMGHFITSNNDIYQYIITWKYTDDTWFRELELIGKKTSDDTSIYEIDYFRDEWASLASGDDVSILTSELFTEGAYYYNRGKLLNGRDEIADEYSYMNSSGYSITLEAQIVKQIESDLIYEIGRYTVSYGSQGYYILRWEKEADGKWRVSLDSNY